MTGQVSVAHKEVACKHRRISGCHEKRQPEIRLRSQAKKEVTQVIAKNYVNEFSFCFAAKMSEVCVIYIQYKYTLKYTASLQKF